MEGIGKYFSYCKVCGEEIDFEKTGFTRRKRICENKNCIREYNKTYAEEIRMLKKELGRCYICEEEAALGHVLCKAHLEKQRLRYYSRRKNVSARDIKSIEKEI